MAINIHTSKRCQGRSMRDLVFLTIQMAIILGGLASFAAEPPEIILADDGKAVYPITVGTAASARVRAAAETLSQYLGRISGARFEVLPGDGRTGIAIGPASDFPQLELGVEFDTFDPQRRDDYLLRTHDAGIYLIGATDLAVENAVWDLLYRLGYRHYFPGKNWEIIPRNAQPEIAVDTVERPDYSFRRVWYGYGSWSENVKETELWRTHNRMQMAFNVNATHTYGTIIKTFPGEFAQHPEYLSHLNGKPTNKLNIANPDLRRLVVKWALAKMEKNPALEVLALDPSDGGGWGQSKEEVALGSISSRVVLLANDVAVALNERFAGKYGRKYVGIYAYNEHAMPPTITVNSNVMVLVATAFNRSGLTLEQQISGWQKQGATIGIREYYNVITASQDLPGKAPGCNYARVSANILKYHKLGARFLSAEGGDGWGSCGLGYYLTARLCWDVGEAARVTALVEDFLEKSFGTAKAPMSRFYAILTPPVCLSESSIGQMYRALAEARELTKDPEAVARINDLLLYTRYVDLKVQYNALSRQHPDISEKCQAFESMIRFLYRSRQSHMVHLQGLWRDMPRRDKALAAVLPNEGRFNAKEGDGSWKSGDPITEAELNAWMEEGVASHQVVDFSPVSYSRNLVPATTQRRQDCPRLKTSYYNRNNSFYTWVSPGQESICLRATLHMKAHPRGGRILLQKVGNAQEPILSIGEEIAGFADDGAGDEGSAGEDGAPAQVDVAQVDVEEEDESAETIPVRLESGVEDCAMVKVVAEPQDITLRPGSSGLYRIIVESRAKYGINLDWDEGIPIVHESTPENHINIMGGFMRYFYVPRETPYVAGFLSSGGFVYDADGNKIFKAVSGNGIHFKIPVEKGQDGRLWTIQGTSGIVMLFTVPPYLFRGPKDLLLPKEVVDAEK